MIDYKYFELFQHSKGSVDKDWKIEYDGGSFTDWDMESESIELSESLCSETELRFGCCEASCLKFTVANIVKPLINEWLTLSVAIDHHNDEPLMIGRYKVNSENLTADRQYKEIVAYDAMFDIINADVAAWYNSVLPNENSTMTLRKFRESFLRYFGLEEVVPEGGLVNDDMTVEKTIDIVASDFSESEAGQVSIMGESLSGLDVITAICEINGCFGHIGRDGKFHYIYLEQDIMGLYPSDDLFPDHAPEHLPQAKTGHLYPQSPKGAVLGSEKYIECRYDDFMAKSINRLQIRQEENDIGVIVGDGNNSYIIQGNFLAYGKSSGELSVIAQNILNKITDIIYRPYDAEVMGNPCLEVGDPVNLVTRYDIIESYILKRVFKGIQCLIDDYSAEGVEEYRENVNGVQSSIIQLKGKTNILNRTIEQTQSTIKDVNENLQSQITQNAGSIKSEVERATKSEESISGELTKKTEALSSTITQTAESIKSEVSATYETKTEAETTKETLQSSIEQNAELIATKVSKGTVSSEISQEADIVSISADRFKLESNNLNINPDGNLISTNGTFLAPKILSNYSEGTDGFALSGLKVQDDGTVKVFFLSVGGGIACKGTLHSNTLITSHGDIKADGNVTGYYLGAGNGGIATTGEKARIVNTNDFGRKKLYCYETTSPLFGDIGNGKTDEAGVCVIFLDNILSETINTEKCTYNVFLTPYAKGNLYVSERTSSYFTVIGSPQIEFAWEIKAKQRDYEYTRLETFDEPVEEENLLDRSAEYAELMSADLLMKSMNYIEEVISL